MNVNFGGFLAPQFGGALADPTSQDFGLQADTASSLLSSLSDSGGDPGFLSTQSDEALLSAAGTYRLMQEQSLFDQFQWAQGAPSTGSTSASTSASTSGSTSVSTSTSTSASASSTASSGDPATSSASTTASADASASATASADASASTTADPTAASTSASASGAPSLSTDQYALNVMQDMLKALSALDPHVVANLLHGGHHEGHRHHGDPTSGDTGVRQASYSDSFDNGSIAETDAGQFKTVDRSSSGTTSDGSTRNSQTQGFQMSQQQSVSQAGVVETRTFTETITYTDTTVSSSASGTGSLASDSSTASASSSDSAAGGVDSPFGTILADLQAFFQGGLTVDGNLNIDGGGGSGGGASGGGASSGGSGSGSSAGSSTSSGQAAGGGAYASSGAQATSSASASSASSASSTQSASSSSTGSASGAAVMTEDQLLQNTYGDFGEVTIDGVKTYLGQYEAGFNTAQNAAQFIAQVLDANTANKGLFTASASGTQLILTSANGSPVTVNSVQADSAGDPSHDISIGLVAGQSGSTLTGSSISSSFFVSAAASASATTSTTSSTTGSTTSTTSTTTSASTSSAA